MNNLKVGSDNVTEKAKLLNWFCGLVKVHITQDGTTNEDINIILATLIKEGSTKFKNPFTTNTQMVAPISSGIKNAILKLHVATDPTKVAERALEASSPAAKAALTQVMNNPEPGAFDIWLQTNPKYGLLNGHEDCKKAITPYMDYNPNPQFITKVYKYVNNDLIDTAFTDRHEYFFLNLCKNYGEMNQFNQELYIPEAKYNTINNDVNSCYFNTKDEISKFMNIFKIGNNLFETNDWCTIKKENNWNDVNDQYFYLNMYSKLFPGKETLETDKYTVQRDGKVYLKSDPTVQVTIDILGNILMADGADYLKTIQPPWELPDSEKPVAPPAYSKILFTFTNENYKNNPYIGDKLKYFPQGRVLPATPLPPGTISYYPSQQGFTTPVPENDSFYPPHEGPNFELLQNIAFPNLSQVRDKYASYPYYPFYVLFEINTTTKVCKSIHALTFEGFSKFYTQLRYNEQEPENSDYWKPSGNTEYTLYNLYDLNYYLFSAYGEHPPINNTTTINGMIYSKNKQGGATISGTTPDLPADVDIPTYVKINDESLNVNIFLNIPFQGNNKMTSITIPSGITSLQKHEFFGNLALKSIKFLHAKTLPTLDPHFIDFIDPTKITVTYKKSVTNPNNVKNFENFEKKKFGNFITI